MILIFAWCIGGVTSDVGAADYIVSATQGFMTPGIMFISLFVVAAFTSFATGTSWGTFAIFLPIAVPLALANDVAVYPAIGAALAGGLFGDHCSPISDTTIMASLGSGSDHLDFVRAQLLRSFDGSLFDRRLYCCSHHNERYYFPYCYDCLHDLCALCHTPLRKKARNRLNHTRLHFI